MIHPIEANLAGKTAVVTGASSGIGKEVARDLARLNARVILVCRDAQRGQAALDEIVADTGNHKTELRLADVSSRASVLAFAAELRKAEAKVDILVNNAGVWLEERRESVDGHEMTWATNVLGAHLLTRELLPLLRAAGREGSTARIINVASELAGALDLSDVELTRRGYDGITAYRQSKAANLLLTWALARKLEGSHVTVNAMHPGRVHTELCREASVKQLTEKTICRFFGRSPAEGADTVSWLAASPQLEGVTGRYAIDREFRESRLRDKGTEDAVYGLCESMVGRAASEEETGTARQSTSSTTLPNPSLLAM